MVRPNAHAFNMHGLATAETAVSQFLAIFYQVVLANRTNIIIVDLLGLDPGFLRGVRMKLTSRWGIRKSGTLAAEVLVDYLIDLPLH